MPLSEVSLVVQAIHQQHEKTIHCIPTAMTDHALYSIPNSTMDHALYSNPTHATYHPLYSKTPINLTTNHAIVTVLVTIHVIHLWELWTQTFS